MTRKAAKGRQSRENRTPPRPLPSPRRTNTAKLVSDELLNWPGTKASKRQAGSRQAQAARCSCPSPRSAILTTTTSTLYHRAKRVVTMT